MRRIIDNDYLTIAVRLFIGGLFIYASYYKIVQPADFARSIWYYHMVPGNLINLMAIILPWLELICGIAIIIGLWYRGAVIWMNLMTVMFIIALSIAYARGISIDCGCFKAAAASTNSARDTLIRDIGLILLTMQLLFSRSKKFMLGSEK